MQNLKETIAIAKLLVFTLGVSGGSATAAEIKDSGTVTYHLGQAAHIPMAGGKVLTEQRMSGMILADNATAPFHLSSQDCLSAGVGDGKGMPVKTTASASPSIRTATPGGCPTATRAMTVNGWLSLAQANTRE